MRVSKEKYNKAVSTIRKFLDEANQDMQSHKDTYAKMYNETVGDNEAVAEYARNAYQKVEDTAQKVKDAERLLEEALEELAALLNTY